MPENLLYVKIPFQTSHSKTATVLKDIILQMTSL